MGDVDDMIRRRTQLWDAVAEELTHAYGKHGMDRWGRHEFFAILKEEVDELWDAIKADAPDEDVLSELSQIVAMCCRYVETGDRYRGTLPPVPSRSREVEDAG